MLVIVCKLTTVFSAAAINLRQLVIDASILATALLQLYMHPLFWPLSDKHLSASDALQCCLVSRLSRLEEDSATERHSPSFSKDTAHTGRVLRQVLCFLQTLVSA